MCFWNGRCAACWAEHIFMSGFAIKRGESQFWSSAQMMLTSSEVNQMKYAQPSADRVLPLFLERWSPRAFADRDVSTADLKTIFEAARWAPSSYNEQPWRFFVGHRGSETYSKILDALVPFNHDWAK